MLKHVEPASNRRIVLNSRPEGAARESDFRLEMVSIDGPKIGEMLVLNHYLSLDPYMRGMMTDRASYVAPIEIGAPMAGLTVGQVVEIADGRICRRRLGGHQRDVAGLFRGRPRNHLEA